MDDFIILTKNRHQLRKAVKLLNTFLADMGFTKHPDKTFIGRISRGFDWMGGWLTDKGITGIAPRAINNHLARCRQLYEQIGLPKVERSHLTDKPEFYQLIDYTDDVNLHQKLAE